MRTVEDLECKDSYPTTSIPLRCQFGLTIQSVESVESMRVFIELDVNLFTRLLVFHPINEIL